MYNISKGLHIYIYTRLCIIISIGVITSYNYSEHIGDVGGFAESWGFPSRHHGCQVNP